MVCPESQNQESAEAQLAAQNGNEPVPIQPVAPPTPSPPVLPPLPPPPSPPVLPPLSPPPPFIYPFNQHHLNDGNGNYYWNGEHGTHLHSWSDVNHQLMINQHNSNWEQFAIIENQDKKLEEKDARIQELLAKVASLETTAQEDEEKLRAKLQEFGELEAKKQDLALQEFKFEISELQRAEAESLKEQLEESEKCRMSAEEMVRKWESCYYHDMDKLLKQNDDKLQAQRASDETFWKRELDHMARRHKAEKRGAQKQDDGKRN
ncbi:hypothetical protein CAEBREN_13232 [Caenorhabditis brenneri]|uniref:Uncharacterized protein n=1 Tax=Caenorhabditis brenneri TaxID=135651 RepID=G0PAI5_CAEBE|nr:hypothetical protein CAEBREN_13232 [Caenorhabditis brenneri]